MAAALLRYPFPFPPAGASLAVLCALYLLPGLIGHDPWKPDDATHFGVVYALLSDGDWLTLRLAGEAYFDNQPLYYWVAALCAKLFGWLVPLHDAARLATGLFGALLLVAMAGAAREFYGENTSGAGALLTVGCLGLLVHIHEVQPQIAVLAASAGVYFGLAAIERRFFAGGVIAGASMGLGFLAGGLYALALMLPLVILAPVACRSLRTREGLAGVMLALLLGAAIIAAWLGLLNQLRPKAYGLWWAQELAGLKPNADSQRVLMGFLALLPWFAWPALPLMFWTLWRRRKALNVPGVVLPAVGFGITLTLVSSTQEARSVNALPLLVPLALLATPAVATLRRGAANAYDWFAMMTFTLFAVLIWLGWVAMLTGWPPRLARQFAKLEPGFALQFSLPAFVAVLVLTLAWLWLIFASPRSPERGNVHWAAGVTLMWCLVMALWLPWIEYGKSYRGLSQSLARTLAKQGSCVLGRDIGEAQRASFHYFSGIVTRRESAADCRLLLVQSSGRGPEQNPGAGWRKIWEERRPGDRNESFRLYRKE
jgi:4-amino-4-deoxy-L-arabinose transferase-like glycosyltransferase